MPALVLEDDDGRELFRGAVSQENVELIAGFVARHMDTFRGIAAFKRALDDFLEGGGQARAPVRVGAAPPRRRRKGRR